ncbi:hypothetical protein NHP200010_14720 [Helicobacter bizzozeronii]|nr:hypothetical protein NHP200010_14720 [Helicobacter bizzozeronii]
MQKQYKGYLSPDEVETKRLKDLEHPCFLVGVYGDDMPKKADEAKKSLEAGIDKIRADLSALCEEVGGGKWSTPKYAINGIKEGVSKLKEQADIQAQDIKSKDDSIAKLTTEKGNAEKRASNAESAKADLEKAINTAYSALIEGQGTNIAGTALDKLTALETKGQEWLKTIDTQQTTIGQQNTTITGLNGRIDKQADQIKDLEGKIDTKTKELNTATQNALQSTQDKQKADKALEDLKAEYGALKGQYNALQTESAEDKKTLQEFGDKITELTTALEKALKPAPITKTPADDPAFKELQKQNGLLQEQNKTLQEQSGDKDKTIADLQEQNARLLSTTQEQALQTLLGEVYAFIQKTAPLDPAKADYLKMRADLLIADVADVARLRETLEQELTNALQEHARKDKGGGKGLC